MTKIKPIVYKTNKLFEFLKEYHRDHGFPPTVREMCEAMGMNSTSTITYYLNYLEKQGKIKRGAFKNRAIEIVDTEPSCMTDNIQNIDFMRNFTRIPILGKITAGEPILAVEEHDDVLHLPNNLFHGEDLFVLNVSGNSMIDAGILDGDMVVIRRQSTANNGDIVAALVDDSATIKRFFRENGHFRLQPENSTMQPMIFDEVQILGKVIGLIRNM
ncbi:MAG: transcriptional repressor LexA [Clostridia bacterium]|nr:transcriptional repressor LexA [Clostridia bacterium]